MPPSSWPPVRGLRAGGEKPKQYQTYRRQSRCSGGRSRRLSPIPVIALCSAGDRCRSCSAMFSDRGCGTFGASTAGHSAGRPGRNPAAPDWRRWTPHEPDPCAHPRRRPAVRLSRADRPRHCGLSRTHDGVMPGLPVADTLKRAPRRHRRCDRRSHRRVDRRRRRRASPIGAIRAAHRQAHAAGIDISPTMPPSPSMPELKVAWSIGDAENRKLTTIAMIIAADRQCVGERA